MQHTIPESHLELLQGIYKAVVLAVDPEATFVAPEKPSEPEEVESPYR